MKLFTVGYEGADIDSFVSTLETVNVTHVIDIRDLPASRRRDFSKNNLRRHLESANMNYTHHKALGDPKPGRDAMRSGNYSLFLSIFNEHLEKEAAQSALDEVSTIVVEEVCVLLCYERDPKFCHRSIVADELSQRTQIDVTHLGVQKLNPQDRQTAADSSARL